MEYVLTCFSKYIFILSTCRQYKLSTYLNMPTKIIAPLSWGKFGTRTWEFDYEKRLKTLFMLIILFSIKLTLHVAANVAKVTPLTKHVTSYYVQPKENSVWPNFSYRNDLVKRNNALYEVMEISSDENLHAKNVKEFNISKLLINSTITQPMYDYLSVNQSFYKMFLGPELSPIRLYLTKSFEQLNSMETHDKIKDIYAGGEKGDDFSDLELYNEEQLKKIEVPEPLVPPDGAGYSPEPQLPLYAFPREVRCPSRWVPIGPHCVTLVSIAPYTTCPGDRKQFKRGIRASMKVSEPGICQVIQSTGVQFDCPPGYQIEMSEIYPNYQHKIEQLGRAFHCSSSNVIPYSLLNGGDCPLGYVVTEEGCKGEHKFPPSLKCPKNFMLGGEAISPYAFRGKEYVKCGKVDYYKGKLWCPNGFEPYKIPYLKLPYGAPIVFEENDSQITFKNDISSDNNLTVKELSYDDMNEQYFEDDDSENYEYVDIQDFDLLNSYAQIYPVSDNRTNLAHSEEMQETIFTDMIDVGHNIKDNATNSEDVTLLKTRKLEERMHLSNIESFIGPFDDNEFNIPELMEMLPTTTSCIQIVAIFEAHCNKYECKSPYMVNLKRIIKDWLFLRLEESEKLSLEIIPSGRDLQYTEKG